MDRKHVAVAVRRRTPIYSAAAAVVVLCQLACGSDSGTTSTTTTCTVSGVTVSASPTTMNIGATSSLVATLNASSACAGGVTWSVAPSGGTLTASGLTATFTATTAGSYAVSATSASDPTKSGTVAVTVTATSGPACGVANGTVTTHSANVTADETWAGDGFTHLVPNSFTISGSAVLTIQPCAIVALGQGVTISVGGTARLVAAGTSSTRFVTFRRNNASQAWGTLRGVSTTSLIDLTWTTLNGGGNFGGMSNPTVAVAGNGYSSVPAPVLHVNNVTIQSSQGVGVYLDANAAFTNTSTGLQITGSGAQPVVTTIMSLGSLPSSALTGNTDDEILIFGPNANVFADLTIHNRGVPVRIPYPTMSIAPLVAGPPVTLTLEAGVVLRFPRVGLPPAPGARVTFGTNGNAPNNLIGVLKAVGTAANEIVFTSGEATPAPGDWVGLWLNTANESRLDHVRIEYAGAASGVVSSNCKLANTPDNAALLVGDFSTQYVPPSNLITNSKITNSAGYGINAMWQAGAFNSVDLTATNVFENNARCKQTYNALTAPGVCPVGGGCTAP